MWARRPEQAAALGVPVFERPAELFDAVDAVAFAVPPAVQARLAPLAAAAGCHLVLEKPVADTVDGAQVAGRCGGGRRGAVNRWC